LQTGQGRWMFEHLRRPRLGRHPCHAWPPRKPWRPAAVACCSREHRGCFAARAAVDVAVRSLTLVWLPQFNIFGPFQPLSLRVNMKFQALSGDEARLWVSSCPTSVSARVCAYDVPAWPSQQPAGGGLHVQRCGRAGACALGAWMSGRRCGWQAGAVVSHLHTMPRCCPFKPATASPLLCSGAHQSWRACRQNCVIFRSERSYQSLTLFFAPHTHIRLLMHKHLCACTNTHRHTQHTHNTCTTHTTYTHLCAPGAHLCREAFWAAAPRCGCGRAATCPDSQRRTVAQTEARPSPYRARQVGPGARATVDRCRRARGTERATRVPPAASEGARRPSRLFHAGADNQLISTCWKFLLCRTDDGGTHGPNLHNAACTKRTPTSGCRQNHRSRNRLEPPQPWSRTACCQTSATC
jgi:hypothetical protein